MRPDREPPGPRLPGRGRLFVAGAATGVAGVATSVLTSVLLRLDSNPLLDVAAVIRDAIPGGVAEVAIGVVGHADKPLLIGGSGLGLVLVTGFVGIQTARRRWSAYLLLVLMAGFALVGVLISASTGRARSGHWWSGSARGSWCCPG